MFADLFAAIKQAAREFRRLREQRARRASTPDPFQN